MASNSACHLFSYFIQMAVVYIDTSTDYLQFLSIFSFNINGTGTTFCLFPLSPIQHLLMGN